MAVSAREVEIVDRERKRQDRGQNGLDEE
jgi:hypothetical protein